jgi:hypothetical protein
VQQEFSQCAENEMGQAMDDKEFLLALREYMEQVEVQIEGEWGVGRSLEELIAANEMSPLYAEVLRRLRA